MAMKNWYLIAYDIREAKRLQKVHYYLKKRATALQNSVFLLHVDNKKLSEILAGVKERTKGKVDDIRLYPIANPNIIWAAGKQVGAMQHLYSGSNIKKNSPPKSVIQKFIGHLFGRN